MGASHCIVPNCKASPTSGLWRSTSPKFAVVDATAWMEKTTATDNFASTCWMTCLSQLPSDPGADKSDEAQGYILKQEFTSVIPVKRKGWSLPKSPTMFENIHFPHHTQTICWTSIQLDVAHSSFRMVSGYGRNSFRCVPSGKLT